MRGVRSLRRRPKSSSFVQEASTVTYTRRGVEFVEALGVGSAFGSGCRALDSG
jgi:hypothetical protein